MKVLVTILLRGSQGGSGRIDPITSALPRVSVRGRAFLSERPNNSRCRYYKGAAGRILGRNHHRAKIKLALPCAGVLLTLTMLTAHLLFVDLITIPPRQCPECHQFVIAFGSITDKL